VDERTDRRTRAHPIRDVLRERGQGQSWLARKLGIEPGYARGMIAGSFRVSDRLRTGASLLLGLPEDALFHPDASSASAPEISDDADSHAGTVAGAGLYQTQEVASLRHLA